MVVAAGMAALLAQASFARPDRPDKSGKEERDALTKERLLDAPCTLEELMQSVDADTGLVATSGKFQCNFKDDSCEFKIEAIDPEIGTSVISELKFNEMCEPILEEAFVPMSCARDDAIALARENVEGVSPDNLTLCKIGQDIEEDRATMTLHNVWTVRLSTFDEVNGLRYHKVEVEDTDSLGCVLFDDDEEEVE
jgi:hypothetical protein